MFGSIGGPELLFVFVLALLLFGPRKLPEIGRTIGKTLSEFRKATYDFRSGLEREIDLEKIQDTRRDLESTVADVARPLGDVAGPVRDPRDAERPTSRGGEGAKDDPPTSGSTTNGASPEQS